MKTLALLSVALLCAAPAVSAQKPARVTAEIHWTVKGHGPQEMNVPPLQVNGVDAIDVPKDGTESFQLGADVTLQLDVESGYLPGGMVSRMTNNLPTIMGVVPGQVLPYGSRIIALHGTLSGKHSLAQTGGCNRLKAGEHGSSSTSANVELSGAVQFDDANATIYLTFVGDRPHGFNAQAEGLKLKGQATYACGGHTEIELTPRFLFSLPDDPAAEGWIVNATKIPGGYEMTASWRGVVDGFTIERFGRFTWKAPQAP